MILKASCHAEIGYSIKFLNLVIRCAIKFEPNKAILRANLYE